MPNIKVKNKQGETVVLHGADVLAVESADGAGDVEFNYTSGTMTITDTAAKNVKNYATAQVVDANLVAANIKKNVTILGITGTHEGGAPNAEDYTFGGD